VVQQGSFAPVPLPWAHLILVHAHKHRGAGIEGEVRAQAAHLTPLQGRGGRWKRLVSEKRGGGWRHHRHRVKLLCGLMSLVPSMRQRQAGGRGAQMFHEHGKRGASHAPAGGHSADAWPFPTALLPGCLPACLPACLLCLPAC